MTNANDQNRLNKKNLARVSKEMDGPRMPEAVRKVLESVVTTNPKFRPDDCVHNRTTKEYGLVREAYEKDGVTMYEVWLPATPDLLRWGYHVSDWAEGVL